MASSSLEDLRNERNEIAQRIVASKSEADEIRTQLQRHQNTLSQLEGTVTQLTQSLNDLIIQKAEIAKQELQRKQWLQLCTAGHPTHHPNLLFHFLSDQQHLAGRGKLHDCAW